MADTSSGRKMPAAPPIDWSRLKDYALKDSIPAGMIRSGIGALTLPGDVYAGRVDPNSNEGIARAADLAGTLTLGSGLAPGAADELRMGIKAYHGTPHDFDRFSMDKIGTGEGAQAYGHGLYFAENEGVAKGYRDALSNVTVDGAPSAQLDAPWRAREALRDVGTGKIASIKDAADALQETGMAYAQSVGHLSDSSDAPRIKALAAEHIHAADWLKNNAAADVKNAGHMYEVDINADPEHFLDWDKPLSQQTDAVKKALAAKYPEYFEPAVLNKYTGMPVEFRQPMTPEAKAAYADQMEFPIATPADQMTAKTLMERHSFDPSTMSRDMRDAGIPGVKYLDAGSRSEGDGSRNYVLFDDNLVNIARKYGLVGSAGIAGAAAASQVPSMAPQDSQALYDAGGAKRGGVINGYARGGSVSAGLINSDVPGRTDRLPMTVQVDSFVVPADIVSGFGQGNTKAGANLLDQIFQQHSGGSDDGGGQPTQIIAAGGEYVVPRAVVASIGNGDVAAGHKVLDNMVRTKRKEFAKHALSLPGPKK